MAAVLVLGGSGMLGHELWRTCAERFDAYATVRSDEPSGPVTEVLDPERIVPGVRAEEPRTIARALDETRPDAVVNCIGIVKQASRIPSRRSASTRSSRTSWPPRAASGMSA